MAPPPRTPKGNRWIWVVLLTLFGIGLPTAIVFVQSRPDGSKGWEIAADRFLNAVIAGPRPEKGQNDRTGFTIAYELLSEKKRETLPFDVFVEEWSRLFDERGFIMAHKRVGNRLARGRTREPIQYILFLGGEEQDHSKLSTLQLDVTVGRRGSRYALADYSLRDVPNPLAAR